MTEIRIGYARCSTDCTTGSSGQAGRLPGTDKGLIGSNRQRPGPEQALVAVRQGDTLVVPKLDKLARSVPDAREIADTLQIRGVKLAPGPVSVTRLTRRGKYSSMRWLPLQSLKMT